MGWYVLLERLESGFLLFETPQGLVPVELSPWQRAYLLWTFRNFRRLSLPLLNSRQASMVRAIAQKNAGRGPHSYDSSLVIGVIERFKLQSVATAVATEPKLEFSHAPKSRITNADTLKIDQAWPDEESTWHKAPPEEHAAEVAAQPNAWLKLVLSKIDPFKPLWPNLTSFKRAWHRQNWLKLGSPKLQRSGRKWIRSEWVKPDLNKLRGSGLATAAGALFLCVGSIIAWHRMGAVAGSEAHSRPTQIESSTQIDSRSLNATELRKTSIIENSSEVVPSRAKTVEAQESSSLAPLDPRVSTPESVVKPAAKTDPIPLLTEHPLRVQNQTSVPKPTPEESEIQATRPPLRSWYPDYSGIEARGVVVLTAEVDSEGVVRSVRVVRGNRALVAAAVRAVRQWRYAPYFEGGKPVATETNIVISVFSDDAVSMSFPPSIINH